jgi:HTH-type transcriptional regulator/antitoxin HipB
LSAVPERAARDLGAAVRAARHARGLTQGDLAARLGLTRATVASYETGRRAIPAETLLRIARVCGQPLAFFEPPADTRAATAAPQPPAPADPQQRAALQALVAALALRPDAIPITLEFVEAYIQDTGPRA